MRLRPVVRNMIGTSCMQTSEQEGTNVFIAMLEVEKAALDWKRELVRAWLRRLVGSHLILTTR